MENNNIGSFGEDVTERQLLKKGYEILKRNFRKKCGEIDIIAKKDDTIAFVEVKTRINPVMGLPREAVDIRKQKHIKDTAMLYISENQFYDTNFRFDVAEVMILDKNVYFNYIENAFF
ncbi:YraN family protein [Tyzzerella sp. An114]|uniref:YraN family protein n=1 Tax=Tyzzerella sp. An114 TaxID=1965545 RepID=UPI000B4353EB|nr:YraN family protein [Tyzzerella sp. An114]OUQ60601.1 YraN family protein [Tyzzerella sp. An114]HIT72241.1 YraN family protein [Candidatus Fimicola cottocaccae]